MIHGVQQALKTRQDKQGFPPPFSYTRQTVKTKTRQWEERRTKANTKIRPTHRQNVEDGEKQGQTPRKRSRKEGKREDKEGDIKARKYKTRDWLRPRKEDMRLKIYQSPKTKTETKDWKSIGKTTHWKSQEDSKNEEMSSEICWSFVWSFVCSNHSISPFLLSMGLVLKHFSG